MTFAAQQEFCSPFGSLGQSTSDASCFYTIEENLAAKLQSNNWRVNNAITDGNFGDAWTSPDVNATTIASDRSNLIYIGSHGVNINGQMGLCLRRCDGATWGSDYAFGPPVLPAAWNGPNWLLLDGCGVVQQNVGWEGVFGGSLHGILGWNNEVTGLTDNTDGPAAQDEFAKLVVGYDSAADAWENAVWQSSDPTSMAMLIPAPNAQDAIEAAGGPHFGPNGDVNPQYYTMNWDHSVNVQSVSTLPDVPQAIYSLTPESMNESYWYNYYGGGAVPSAISHPSGNEDLYRNPYVTVDHYLASGGLLVAGAATGTAKGFGITQALQYAVNWLTNNGGMPADAALTYAGEETVSPTSGQATSDQPYPNRRQYAFIWRHASSGILDNDKIGITIDDAGQLTTYTDTVKYCLGSNSGQINCNNYYTYYYQAPPWIPQYHVHTFTRLWRSLGAPISTFSAKVSASSYALCSTGMSAQTSEAVPCGVNNSTSGRTIYTDLTSGASTSSSESI